MMLRNCYSGYFSPDCYFIVYKREILEITFTFIKNRKMHSSWKFTRVPISRPHPSILETELIRHLMFIYIYYKAVWVRTDDAKIFKSQWVSGIFYCCEKSYRGLNFHLGCKPSAGWKYQKYRIFIFHDNLAVTLKIRLSWC